MLYLTPTLAMLYLAPIIIMLYLTPIFAMLYLTPDIWHRHSVFTPVLSIYTDTWHVTLDILFMTPALGIYTSTRYIDPVLDMSYLTPAPDTRYMICFHVVQIPGLDILTLDWTLLPLIPVFIWHIHDYHFYGDLAWLLYQIFGTPVLLYSWTPEIGRLLTLLLILYSCWPP